MDWKRVREDLLLSFSSQFFYKAVGYVILAVLARYLAKEEFGGFLFAASFAGVAVLFTEFGSGNYLVRAVATDRTRALEHFGAILSTRLPLLVAYIAVVNGIAAMVKPQLLTVIVITSIYIGLKDLYASFSSLFVGLKRVRYTVAVYGTGQVVLLASVLLVVLRNGGLTGILGAYVVWTVVLVGLASTTARLRIGRIRLRWRPAVSAMVIRKSVPLFALIVLTLLHFKADTIMLGFMRPLATVATYEAAAKLLEASQFAVRPMTLIFFPICVELAARHQWPRLRHIFGSMLLATGGVGVGIAIAVIAAAGVVIPTVFGSGFDESIGVLRVIYLSVPVLYITIVGTFLATSIHLERLSIYAMLSGLGINIVLNWLLIPSFGALGAAWASVISQSLIAIAVMVIGFRGIASQAVASARGGDLSTEAV